MKTPTVEYDANYKVTLHDLPPLPEFLRQDEFKFKWNFDGNNLSKVQQYNIPYQCPICGQSLNVRKRLDIVTTEWAYGKPWGLIDIEWKCIHNHSPYSSIRYQSKNGQWVSSRIGCQTDTCFIATAAYGTSMATEIDYLRWYRDAVLLKHTLGKAFVRTYYRLSPPIANFITTRESLRTIVRWLLNPIVKKCKSIKENQ